MFAFNAQTLSYEKQADFISSDVENKIHETAPVGGFFEGEYPGTVRVSCIESLTNELFEDYFYFSVDFSAPETQIILTEETREERRRRRSDHRLNPTRGARASRRCARREREPRPRLHRLPE